MPHQPILFQQFRFDSGTRPCHAWELSLCGICTVRPEVTTESNRRETVAFWPTRGCCFCQRCLVPLGKGPCIRRATRRGLGLSRGSKILDVTVLFSFLFFNDTRTPRYHVLILRLCCKINRESWRARGCPPTRASSLSFVRASLLFEIHLPRGSKGLARPFHTTL